MRIGVDIDGTLNDVYGFYVDYGTKYSVECNLGGLRDLGASDYKGMYDWSVSAGREFWRKYGLVEMSEIPARAFAAEVLARLKMEGNEVWIVTGRSNSDTLVDGMRGCSWEEITRDWLGRNGIFYERIEFGVKNKAEFCVENNIDVMVEDHPRFLGDFDGRVRLLVYDAPYNREYRCRNSRRVHSWWEVYREIKEVKK